MTERNHGDRDDRGLATLFLILAMTTIFAGAGFAIDVGQYVVHARSAQNSADATALAVATDCALTGAPIEDYSPYRKSGQRISPETPTCTSGEVEITVTKDVEGLFLPAVTAGTVNRSATARWGTLGAATTVPIVIADCEFERALFGDLTTPVDDVILYTDTPPPGGCSSPAGGFGMLDTTRSNPCATTIAANSTATGDPGNDLRKLESDGCITPLPKSILIPVYDTEQCELSDCKGNGIYFILGFAMFTITGYSLPGNTDAGTLEDGCPDDPPGGGVPNCIQGDFVKLLAPNGTPGDSADFGVTKISLSS